MIQIAHPVSKEWISIQCLTKPIPVSVHIHHDVSLLIAKPSVIVPHRTSIQFSSLMLRKLVIKCTVGIGIHIICNQINQVHDCKGIHVDDFCKLSVILLCHTPCDLCLNLLHIILNIRNLRL